MGLILDFYPSSFFISVGPRPKKKWNSPFCTIKYPAKSHVIISSERVTVSRDDNLIYLGDVGMNPHCDQITEIAQLIFSKIKEPSVIAINSCYSDEKLVYGIIKELNEEYYVPTFVFVKNNKIRIPNGISRIKAISENAYGFRNLLFAEENGIDVIEEISLYEHVNLIDVNGDFWGEKRVIEVGKEFFDSRKILKVNKKEKAFFLKNKQKLGYVDFFFSKKEPTELTVIKGGDKNA